MKPNSLTPEDIQFLRRPLYGIFVCGSETRAATAPGRRGSRPPTKAVTTPTAMAVTGQAVGSSVAARDLPATFAAVAAAESANLVAGRVRNRIYFHFDKNQKDPTNSRLILYRVTYIFSRK